MTQQTRYPGPGVPVRDDDAPVLHTAAAVSADVATTAGDGYVQVDRPGDIDGVATLGTIGASATMTASVWGSETGTATGEVMLGSWAPIAGTHDDTVQVLKLSNVYHKYLAVYLDYGGTGSVVIGVKVHQKYANLQLTDSA